MAPGKKLDMFIMDGSFCSSIINWLPPEDSSRTLERSFAGKALILVSV
jgi:hypothetical protein